jgi:hypothetical protein
VYNQSQMATKKELEQTKYELDRQIVKTIKLQEKLVREAKGFKSQFIERFLKLITGGFGLVAALAWNEAIKEGVNVYIKPYFGENSGFITMVVYAIIVTALAVVITYQLSKLRGEDDK